MKRYYQERAAEYDEIYEIPMRQQDIRTLQADLSECFSQRDVLEIACGTGYWTQFISMSAASVHATDINQAVVDIARSRNYPAECNVSFYLDDAFRLDTVEKKFDGVFAGFWLSHVDKSQMTGFLQNMCSKLSADALVVFVDNRYVHEHSTTVHRYDENGNGYQLRKLKNGKEFEVVKNFPDLAYFESHLCEVAYDIEFIETEFFWKFSCRMKS